MGFDVTENKAPENKVVSPSGATSSRKVVPYHLVPPIMYQLTAGRFGLGSQYHGDVNYQKCIQYTTCGDKILDLNFARDRYNHGVHHLLNLKASGNHRDDNIGAVAWFLSFAAWVEEEGFDWQRILNPRRVNESRLMKTGMGDWKIEWTDPKTGIVNVDFDIFIPNERFVQSL